MMNAIYLSHPRGITDRVVREVRSVPGLDLVVETGWESMTPDQLTDRIRHFDILLLSRGPALSDSLAEDPGRLRHICYLHGSIRQWIGLPILRSDITVTNWGDAPAVGLAMGSLVLLQASLLDLHKRIMAVRRGASRGFNSVGGTVTGLRVGVYGYGFAGREFARLAGALGADIRIFDPYAADVPAHFTRVASLEELFDGAQAIVIHAGLTAETEKSVTVELLSRLPDQGVVINTARGAIIDQSALFAELKSGRLRAGLDVLSPDELPENHEARSWENLIWTCHRFMGESWPGDDTLGRRDTNLLDNLHAIVEGRSPRFVIDEQRYNLMT
jgi:phosphoglycerate dehydrogenase-like enzyme